MRTDNEIKTDIVAQIDWDDSVRDSGIDVIVDRGKVILNGHINSLVARDSALRDALLVDGVIEVEDRLFVKHAEETRIPSNEELYESIRDAFRALHNIDSTKIETTTNNGIVTLRGSVDAFWKKKIVERNVKNVTGVLEVRNELSVVPTKKITDEKIARDILEAMERNRHILAEDVDMEVKNGEVILSGEIGSRQVKSELETLVRYTSGVQDMKDNVIVKYPGEV